MFRDPAALTFMLLAPFLLTIAMGFVTGRFSGGSTGISDIPVIIVNLDQGDLGNALEDLFNSEDLAELMEPTASTDPEAARQLIESDQASAAIIIPKASPEVLSRSLHYLKRRAGLSLTEGAHSVRTMSNPNLCRSKCIRILPAPPARVSSKPSWTNSSRASRRDVPAA